MGFRGLGVEGFFKALGIAWTVSVLGVGFGSSANDSEGLGVEGFRV